MLYQNPNPQYFYRLRRCRPFPRKRTAWHLGKHMTKPSSARGPLTTGCRLCFRRLRLRRLAEGYRMSRIFRRNYSRAFLSSPWPRPWGAPCPADSASRGCRPMFLRWQHGRAGEGLRHGKRDRELPCLRCSSREDTLVYFTHVWRASATQGRPRGLENLLSGIYTD